MILAGDIGGTKINLALFECIGPGRVGHPIDPESHKSTGFGSFEELIESYRGRHAGAVDAISFGVAGVVIQGRAKGTHIPWEIDASAASRRLRGTPVHLMNDLVAAGYAVPALAAPDLVSIQEGTPAPEANAGLISAGTGLGESILARVAGDLIPIDSEAGHADFAPRTDDEIELFRFMRARYGRVSYERVLSGQGLVDTARWTHERDDRGGASAWKAHAAETPAEDLAALVSERALAGACRWCGAALDIFVSVYGAEAGNLALLGMTRAGIYLGGGIAPKILPALQGERFLQAFRDKDPHAELMRRIPVSVIRNQQASVLGAARYATLEACGPPTPSL
ncbi:MAG TPA: glucokinase [Candidatus Dormibacteraeota bacterium]|nr:glucokinase [Candidatus Dormibacteraeota bacterium]